MKPSSCARVQPVLISWNIELKVTSAKVCASRTALSRTDRSERCDTTEWTTRNSATENTTAAVSSLIEEMKSAYRDLEQVTQYLAAVQ